MEMNPQLLGWGIGLIVVGLLLALLVAFDIVTLAFLPWVAGTIIVVGVVMAVVSMVKPAHRRETRV